MKLKALLLSLAFLACSGLAHAVPVQVDFTATGFLGGPASSISGSFVYNAASLTSKVQSIIGVDLHVNGYAYTLSEIGFTSVEDISQIGGLVNSLTMISGTSFHDFIFAFNRITQEFGVFGYSTPGVAERYFTVMGNASIHSPTSVPEPTTLELFGLSVLALVVTGRRRDLRYQRSLQHNYSHSHIVDTHLTSNPHTEKRVRNWIKAHLLF